MNRPQPSLREGASGTSCVDNTETRESEGEEHTPRIGLPSGPKLNTMQLQASSAPEPFARALCS